MRSLEALRPGDAVGAYVVQDLLGQGGMAAVYRVRHAKLGSVHALKVVTVPSRSVMKRLMLEGQVQARLAHRNIVAVTDVIEVTGCPGLVMEYVRGPSLYELVYATKLPLDVVDGLVRGLLRGLAAAHADGLVHRDLKPANVLIAMEHDGLVPKIADFGLVKDVAEERSATKSGAFMGTPQYTAPEQIRSAKTVDARADLFAAGAILYELLTGQMAFPGEDLLVVFNHVASGTYEPLPSDLPERMRDAVTAALQPDPDQRVPSAEALLELWSGDVPDRDVPHSLGEIGSGVMRAYQSLQPAETGTVEARRQLSPTGESAVLTRPPPSAPSSWPTVAGLLLTTTGLLGLSGTAVLVIVTGVVAWFLLTPAPPTAPPTPAVPPPTEPAPVLPADEATPDDTAADDAEGDPEEAEPSPSPRRRRTAPRPAPEPDAELSYVVVEGDLTVLLEPVGGGRPQTAGEVDPGTYTVLRRDTFGALMQITVASGQTVRLKCSTLVGKCKEQR